MKRRTIGTVLGVVCLALMLMTGQAWSGLFDDLSKAAGAVADKVSKDASTVGKEMGITDKSQKKDPGSLPGGVNNRIKKINQEMDRADKALSTGSGSAEDKAKRAENYLKRAERYKDEIEKRYAGKFDPEHPDVTAAYERMDKMRETIESGGAPPPPAATAAKETEKPKQAESAQSAQSAAAEKPKTKAAGKLPGGVKNRLGKIDKELDRAEKELAKGGGKTEAKRAENYLKKADRYKKEIDSQYAGKYDPDHPDAAKTLTRLETVRADIAAASDQADKAAADAAQKAEAQKQADAAAAAAAAAAKDKEKQQAAQAAQNAKNVCDQWKQRLEQFTQGDKPLHVYSTQDAALMSQWKGYYDEAVKARQELDASGLDKKSCFGLESTEKLLATYMERFEDTYKQYQADQVPQGGIVFSKSPINPANPAGLTDSFKSGDHIYALIQTKEPLSKYYGKQGNIMIKIKLGGQKVHAQFIMLKKPEDLAKKYAIFEIAPDPASMLSYTGKLPEYGKSSANMMQGPMEMTHHLGKLSPGKHTLELNIASYGLKLNGSATIEGSDFGFYAKLNQKMNSAAAETVVMPKAQMINKTMEAKMKALLENAGWDNVYRLSIKDKDWWVERVSGGDSPIKARYLNVAAMRKDDQGYCYQICTFHQDKLITGAWGELYLSHQGNKVRVLDKNKDK